MNTIDKLSDKEFIPFLQNLGVDTRNQSFEWMLNNPEFAPALEWIYNNLDCNNVLTVREKRRYFEIQKDTIELNKELSSNMLEEDLDLIKEQYPGICFPGECEKFENVEFKIKEQRDKLNLLEKQEAIIRDLIKQNENNNEQLNLEIKKINAIHQQTTDELKSAADSCIKLAQEIESLTDDVISVVSHNIDLYKTCADNKDTSYKFFVYGPFDQYKQSQDLFQSHFDLYVSKKIFKRHNDVTGDNVVLNEAKSVESRLSEAMSAYVVSKVELSSEQDKLQLVTNYNHPHCSQIGVNMMEVQTEIQLLEQEEGILEQQIQNAIKEFVEEKTNIVDYMAIKAALDIRKEISNDLIFLLKKTQQAFALDKILYSAVRHELYNIEEFLQFASQLRQYVLTESEAVASRMDSMREICTEQTACEENILTLNSIMKHLHSVLGIELSNNSCIIAKQYHDLKRYIKELKHSVKEGYEKNDEVLIKFKELTKPLIDYIWDGLTKQPNCADRTVAALTHALRQEMAKIDERIVEISSKYNSVKSGDKQHLRKLWQWFMTDPSKLFFIIKAAESGKFINQ